MVLAYHCIFGTYGFWLPMDPRGSWSDHVASWELFRFGPPKNVQTRRSVAHVAHDRELREAAKRDLKYPPVSFTGEQALSVGRGFKKAGTEAGYLFYACSILPQHVHLVLGRHTRPIRTIVGHLKSNATREVRRDPTWPDDKRSVWGEGGWNVFLNSDQDIRRAIRYVEANPVEEGKRRQQQWSFVVPFPGTQ